MTFATPLALLGLLSLPVIFVLHMMRSRSRSYTVSSLSLWSFLDPQVRGARARRIPLTWLLLLDLLIAALLAVALANPQIEVTRRGEEARHTIVLLDVSTSMAAGDEPGSRLQAAAAEIEGLLQNGGPGEVFTLITSAHRPKHSATAGWMTVRNWPPAWLRSRRGAPGLISRPHWRWPRPRRTAPCPPVCTSSPTPPSQSRTCRPAPRRSPGGCLVPRETTRLCSPWPSSG